MKEYTPKERFSVALDYLNQVSLKKPKDVRIEEIESDRMVLSYTEECDYRWEEKTTYKEFFFSTDNSKSLEVLSMKIFNKNI